MIEKSKLKTIVVNWASELKHRGEEIKRSENDADVVMRCGVKKVNFDLLEMDNRLADDIREGESVGTLDELPFGRAQVPVLFSLWFPTRYLVLLFEPRLNPDRTLQHSFWGWRFQQDFRHTQSSNLTSLVKGGTVPQLHYQLSNSGYSCLLRSLTITLECGKWPLILFERYFWYHQFLYQTVDHEERSGEMWRDLNMYYPEIDDSSIWEIPAKKMVSTPVKSSKTDGGKKEAAEKLLGSSGSHPPTVWSTNTGIMKYWPSDSLLVA